MLAPIVSYFSVLLRDDTRSKITERASEKVSMATALVLSIFPSGSPLLRNKIPVRCLMRHMLEAELINCRISPKGAEMICLISPGVDD